VQSSPRSRIVSLVCAPLAFTVASLPARSHAATVYFAHADEQYLRATQHDAGAALAPDNAGQTPLPLVVFLHGTNPNGDMHLWLGGGGHDLRPVALRLYQSKKVQPFILAGPSQTRAASRGRRLWTRFDFGAFIDDVARALDGHAVVDRDAVVFMGHSGAGCNVNGGIASDFWSQNRPLPRALIAVDPCMDADLGVALGRRPARVPLWLMWQSRMWPREPAAFRSALAARRPAERIDRIEELNPTGPNPHDAILPLALERAARALFAKREAHDGAS